MEIRFSIIAKVTSTLATLSSIQKGDSRSNGKSSDLQTHYAVTSETQQKSTPTGSFPSSLLHDIFPAICTLFPNQIMPEET